MRILRAARDRGELRIDGPWKVQVVRRSELDRWLASHGTRRVDVLAEAQSAEDMSRAEREAEDEAMRQVAERLRRGGR